MTLEGLRGRVEVARRIRGIIIIIKDDSRLN